MMCQWGMIFIIDILAFSHGKTRSIVVAFPAENEFYMVLLQTLFGSLDGFMLILFLLITTIWLIALVAVANGRFNDNITKLCWFFIILFLNIIGVLLFVFWGRKEVFKTEKNNL